jgi:hypothetical protein
LIDPFSFVLFFSASAFAACILSLCQLRPWLKNGFVCSLAEHPNVLSVFENQPKKLHTTRSWDFLGLEKGGEIQYNSAWKTSRFGEDTIIGNLDTGVFMFFSSLLRRNQFYVE